jgi:CRP-like cAMP-binding protein
MANSKEAKPIKKGEALFREDERLNGVFCVRNGVAKRSKISDNGRDQIVKLANRGEVLGQRSVISNKTTI